MNFMRFVTLRVVATATSVFLAGFPVLAQDNLTPNGISDSRLNAYGFTNATIYQANGELLENGTLLISNGEIVEVNTNSSVPDGYFEIDLQGDYIYPGFIDAYSDYGIPELEPAQRNGGAETLFSSANASNVNDAIKADFRASVAFTPDEEALKKYRALGFSTVLSLRSDGIARGTSALITLGDENANESIIIPDVANHFSLSKGSSAQTVPVSLMGSFALIRQTLLDADWYGQQDVKPFTDHSLDALNNFNQLPKIIEVNNWHQALTADKVGDEFDIQYVLKTSGDSYQRANLIKATDATLIVPVSFPDKPEVDDILTADDISLADLKHWELAPFNLRILAEHQIPFAVTTDDARDDFWRNLRKAVSNGLPRKVAVDSITRVPAEILGVSDRVGTLQAGRLANFVIASGDVLESETVILENWVRGNRYELNSDLDSRAGDYQLALNNQNLNFKLRFSGISASAEISVGDDTFPVNLDLSDDLISFSFFDPETEERLRLTGWSTETGWRGNGRSADGSLLDWQLNSLAVTGSQVDVAAEQENLELPAPVLYPFTAYGREALPEQNDLLIRGATVWTNEDQGIAVTDVLVRNGKIAAVGENLSADGATLIDGTGKHLTPGIIDEHSHIALFNINEVATNSSMVRMKDVVDSENINIYRNLAGGVVAAQLLHGSANPIGGQSALIKMRWGSAPQDLLIEGADEYIKFALGENVKRSRNPASVRYPQTRMGVEQVFVNAFSQAQEYGKEWDEYNDLPRSQQRNSTPPRRDLVHEAMLEILNGERFVTSHSYVQSEINMLMEVAESFDFNINTFTHILEGYKVADKMAQHGAGGSTFSDWWGYKWEVRYAIPYNAALMQQAGVVVALNSDDAEMSRRLNQEAAKAVKYGNVSEIDALKMVTLNPAKLLHLDDRMGSIREGKDADLVLWSDHPLSVYAVADTTWVDGIAYYSRAEDRSLRQQIADERARIIAKISAQGGEEK